jgi:hypothetical protein
MPKDSVADKILADELSRAEQVLSDAKGILGHNQHLTVQYQQRVERAQEHLDAVRELLDNRAAAQSAVSA